MTRAMQRWLGVAVLAGGALLACSSQNGGPSCTSNDECLNGQTCSKGACVASCTSSAACQNGQSCVAGACLSDTSDGGGSSGGASAFAGTWDCMLTLTNDGKTTSATDDAMITASGDAITVLLAGCTLDATVSGTVATYTAGTSCPGGTVAGGTANLDGTSLDMSATVTSLPAPGESSETIDFMASCIKEAGSSTGEADAGVDSGECPSYVECEASRTRCEVSGASGCGTCVKC